MASATLSWKVCPLGTKTGTTILELINDYVALFNSKLSDSNFTWQVASSSTAVSPYYIVFKRKSGVPGRILMVAWTSAPAGNNTTILDMAPTTNTPYVAYFPNGNVDIPSNLTVASGTIMGNDTNAVKVSAYWPNPIYTTSIQPFYFDSADVIWFGVQNPTSTASNFLAAGEMVVDMNDNAYGAVFSSGTQTSLSGFTYPPMAAWTSPKPNAGSSSQCVRTNFGNPNSVYWQMWGHPIVSTMANDIFTDSVSGKVMLAPQQLIGMVNNAYALSLKLRQVAAGPFMSQAFGSIFVNGPTLLATQFCGNNTGGGSYPWMTHVKI